MKHIIYILFYLISLLPFQVLFRLSKINILIKYRSDVVKKNIETSFPELNESQTREILKKIL